MNTYNEHEKDKEDEVSRTFMFSRLRGQAWSSMPREKALELLVTKSLEPFYDLASLTSNLSNIRLNGLATSQSIIDYPFLREFFRISCLLNLLNDPKNNDVDFMWLCYSCAKNSLKILEEMVSQLKWKVMDLGGEYERSLEYPRGQLDEIFRSIERV